jgi:hypothetical protein
MFCVMRSVVASEAAPGLAATGAEAAGNASAFAFCIEGVIAAGCALSSFAAADDDAVPPVAVLSPPQPLRTDNVEVASATTTTPVRRMSRLMSASSFVKAHAVSNPFKK